MEFLKFKSNNRPSEYLDYMIKSPEGSDNEKLPLVIYLHGAGGLGNDVTIMQYWMPVSELEKRPQHRCRLVLPQCHAPTWIELYDVLLEFIESFTKRDDIDSDRIYLMGESLGGYATWQVAMSRPDWFAAIMPICGGGISYTAPRLVKVPVWAFHGEKDTVVYPEESKRIVDKINACGGNAKLTIFPDCEHDSWSPAMTDDATWEWLFSQKKNVD